MALLKRTRSAGLLALLLLLGSSTGHAQEITTRIKDLTHHAGEVPRRLVGYGLVVGLDGTGDRSWGGLSNHNATVQSVINLLRRFNLVVPPDYLRLRNVAAVLVTAEVSPFLRTGGRFEVSVSAMGDALSLNGGVLWMTPLVAEAGGMTMATAQGTLITSTRDDRRQPWLLADNNGRIPDGGLIEVDPPAVFEEPRLYLNEPDRLTAMRIAAAVNAALGDGTARSADPGSVDLNLTGEDALQTLAGIDTLRLVADTPARIVIHSRDGMVVGGGDVRVGSAVIHHGGLTLQIGGFDSGLAGQGVVHVEPGAPIRDIAIGLHAAGASPAEMAAIFEALRDAGALRAEVIVR